MRLHLYPTRPEPNVAAKGYIDLDVLFGVQRMNVADLVRIGGAVWDTVHNKLLVRSSTRSGSARCLGSVSPRDPISGEIGVDAEENAGGEPGAGAALGTAAIHLA
jgi:hypothetical protein